MGCYYNEGKVVSSMFSFPFSYVLEFEYGGSVYNLYTDVTQGLRCYWQALKI